MFCVLNNTVFYGMVCVSAAHSCVQSFGPLRTVGRILAALCWVGSLEPEPAIGLFLFLKRTWRLLPTQQCAHF